MGTRFPASENIFSRSFWEQKLKFLSSILSSKFPDFFSFWEHEKILLTRIGEIIDLKNFKRGPPFEKKFSNNFSYCSEQEIFSFLKIKNFQKFFLFTRIGKIMKNKFPFKNFWTDFEIFLKFKIKSRFFWLLILKNPVKLNPRAWFAVSRNRNSQDFRRNSCSRNVKLTG